MGAIWLIARSELRSRLRGAIALGVLVGLFTAVVIGSAAGARRTESAVPRFLAERRASDALVGNGLADPLAAAIEDLPLVAEHGRVSFVLLAPEAPSGEPGSAFGVTVIAPLDDRWTRTFDRPLMVAGRMPSLDDPHEIMVNEAMARTHGMSVGSRMTFYAYAPAQMQEIFAGSSPEPSGPAMSLRVVGLMRHARDIAVGEGTARDGVVVTSPAFFRRYGDRAANFGVNAFLRLEAGARGIPALRAATDDLRARLGRPGDEVTVETTEDILRPARVALSVQAVGAWLFAIAAGIAVILMAGQSVSRRVSIAGDAAGVLGPLGMTRFERFTALMVPPAVIGIVGVSIAVPAAFAASPIFPTSFGRLAESDPGLRFDAPALVGGAVLSVLVLLVRVAPAAWGAARLAMHGPSPLQDRRSAVVARLGRAGGSASSVVGVRMALEPGRGRTAVPVRAAAISAILGVAAVTVSFIVWASLQNVVATPRLYGWNWDVGIAGPDQTDLVPKLIDAVRAAPDIADFSTATMTDVRLDGRMTQGYAVTGVRGSVFLSLAEGRAPATEDEIVLGSATMRTLKIGIGDDVGVLPESGDGRPFPMTVVGRAIFAGLDGEPLADGAGFIGTAMDRIGADVDFIDVIARLRDSVDPQQALIWLREAFGDTNVFLPARPAAIENLRRVTSLPLVLGALMVALALATIVHALASTTRRRIRDLAILKSLGFTGRDVGRAIGWQATTFATLALIVGLPAGIAAGRWGWRLIGDRIGVPLDIIAPSWLALAIPAMLVLAVAISRLPARAAARTQPAAVLRSE